MTERCPDCGRPVLPRLAAATGWISRCNRRVATFGAMAICETVGNLRFDEDNNPVRKPPSQPSGE
jgi:hypothetical protein